MDARTFYETHGKDRVRQVALAAGSKPGYFMQMVYGHRRPSPDLARRLVEASGGELGFADLLPPKNAQ